MKYRVERERTDHGYGPYWVILDSEGDVVMSLPSWQRAWACVCFIVRSNLT